MSIKFNTVLLSLFTIILIGLPYLINDHNSYLLYNTILTIIGVGLLYRLNIFRSRSQKSEEEGNAFNRTLWPFGFILIISALSVLIFNIRELKNSNEERISLLEQNQSLIKETEARIGNMELVNRVLDRVYEEIKSNKNRTLSEDILETITSTSKMLHPQEFVYIDTIASTQNPYSKERGHLLISLLIANIDSNSMNKIIAQTSFAGADLAEADLSDKNLSGIILTRANLTGTDLTNTKLDSADLRGAMMRSSKMFGTSLRKVAMNRVDLSWTDIDKSIFSDTYMAGANLRATKISDSDFNNVNISLGSMSEALVNLSSFREVKMYHTNLIRCNLIEVDMSDADMRNAKLNDANFDRSILTGSDLEGAFINNKLWFDYLDAKNVKGVDTIKQEYTIKDATVKNESLWILTRGEN